MTAATRAPIDWLLTPEQRGNPFSSIDASGADGRAYTTGNAITVHVDGAEYFGRLAAVLRELRAGDRVMLTDWRGDGDERLDAVGTQLAALLVALARRGVDVRGLVWRSHSDRLHFSETENIELAAAVNQAGGEILLDERVRRGGSHHQKVVIVRRVDGRDVAFVGGIDLGHGRHDSPEHRGDPQTIPLDARYGPRPRWHDIQLEVSGPAVRELEHSFRERWNDPLRLDHRGPWHRRIARLARQPRRSRPLPDPFPGPHGVAGGDYAVQVLRTYAAKRPPFPFAPDGERSVARAYLHAFARARSFIYIEDQYLWSPAIARALSAALRRAPALRIVAVVPRYPDRDDRITGPPQRFAQSRLLATVREAGAGRVDVYDLEGDDGVPIYVHAKVCIVDDEWMIVGSDNLNRRSWTYDSELSCAIVDLGDQGDGSRIARETRRRLWGEHLDRARPGDRAPASLATNNNALDDPLEGIRVLRASADALDAWHATDQAGTRPAGRLRNHHVEPVRGVSALIARFGYRWLVDPDGRPFRLRLRREF